MSVLVVELLVASVMVLLTVTIHAAGLLGLGRMLVLHDRFAPSLRINPISWDAAIVTGALTLGLMALHGIEIWAYGLLFLAIDAVSTLRDAVYFSTISYATIGYSDAPIRPEWRLLAAIEGVNGTLLMGWSVAFFVTVMTRFFPAARPHRRRAP